MKQPHLLKYSLNAAAWRVGTLMLLAAFTLGLKLMPYRTLSRFMPRAGLRTAAPWRKRQLSSNMDWAARRIPGATCLPQAMAGYVVFAFLGFESRIRIGVERDGDGKFQAHATLMSGDHIVLGDGPAFRSFVSLTELRPGR